MRVKRNSFGAKLPATPCDEEMRDRMKQRANETGVSLAELQRSAFDLFLRKNATKSIEKIQSISQE